MRWAQLTGDTRTEDPYDPEDTETQGTASSHENLTWLWIQTNYFLDSMTALTGGAQRAECRPANHKVTSSTLGRGTRLGCRLVPAWGRARGN